MGPSRRTVAHVALGLVLLGFGAPVLADGPMCSDQHGTAWRWQAPFDRLTVVDFAASWCGPCRHSLPRLQAFADAHPDVQVLVVSVDQTEAGRDELVSSLGLHLPVLWDHDHAIAEHYRPPAMPSSFLLSPEGLILHRSPGSTEQEWTELVAAVQRELDARSAGAGAE